MASYDPKDIKVVIGGVLITGYADDTFVEIEYTASRWSMKVGCDGEGVFSKSNDESATVKLSLMPTSDSNLVLNGFWAAGGIINADKFPVMITDKMTNTIHTGISARILKGPGKSYKKEVDPIQWEIGVLKLISNYGAASIGLNI